MDASQSSTKGGTVTGTSTKSSTAASVGGGHVNDAAAQAAASLQLLLREDRLLTIHGMTDSSQSDTVAFSYAAALLQAEENGDEGTATSSTQHRAERALQDVERKLALVQSLAVKWSRTRPEAVAGPLLRLHGYHHQTTSGVGADADHAEQKSHNTNATTTLATIRDRADRLERQAEVLDTVARRVEGSLSRGLQRMQVVTTRLDRVLRVSNTLKQIMRFHFELTKCETYVLEDLRDLTRGAASVALLEDVLRAKQEFQESKLDFMERSRPRAERIAREVREAAAALLEEQYKENSPTSLSQLGAVLQVYYHLGELPQAVWKAVNHAHGQAESASSHLWNTVTLLSLTEQAKKAAEDSKALPKKLKMVRANAAHVWAQSISQAASQVRNLQRVLARKTDPVHRQTYIDVVATAPIPPEYNKVSPPKDSFSIFSLFWVRFSSTLGKLLKNVSEMEQGRWISDIAGLYPAVRAAAIEMLRMMQDSLPEAFDDAGAASIAGVLGGSRMLDDAFLGWTTGQLTEQEEEDNPQSAEAWTRSSASQPSKNNRYGTAGGGQGAVFNSFEWNALRGDKKAESGLWPLQQVFLKACMDRLCQPLQYMFPENVTLDDDGVAIPAGLRLLPSKYDVQRFDENIRQELSLADPREGGGDLTLVTMIAECVVDMILQFCNRARNALSGVGEKGYVEEDWSPTEALQHDRKVIAILHTMSNYIKSAPEKTFLAPYRPAILPQHEEAAALCQRSLQPALQDIEKMIKSSVLGPLCRALNRLIGQVIAKMHLGAFLEGNISLDDGSPSFVQKHLAPVYETIAEYHLGKFPPIYATFIASSVAKFSIYNFVSNASLIRPLGESVRLHLTQDLADFEMALEQFLLKAGGTNGLSDIDNGRPYAELRAVRQMLFWTGLENKSKESIDVSKSILREAWIKDVRPSTVLHYLFSNAPQLLSSPHITKHVKAEEYVWSLVQLDGSCDAGEVDAWVTIMACCDSYQQRASSAASAGNEDGDSRIAQILLLVGQELLRRRRN